MKKVLLSAFACDPSKGSEPGNGWNWAFRLAKKGFEVHCFTRITGKKEIDLRERPGNLHFHYVSLPIGLEKLYTKGTLGMYLYYLVWQWVAYRKALTLHKAITIDVVQHVTWGSIQMGSYMYKLKVPFVFGPSGGGQKAPIAFKRYFLNHWQTEEKREKVAAFLTRYNPGFRSMVKKAQAVLVSNWDTYNLAKKHGAREVNLILDAALPTEFYPEAFTEKVPTTSTLKLLWVGRFMPRKGILLLLDVMKELSDYSGITLTVVGDGEMKEIFLETVKRYGLENSVDWKGKVPFESIKEYYRTHDAFFFTSLRDSCPAQLIEAMAFGLPIITINLHGQALIVNDKTGIVCACDTPELAIAKLKEAILTLYNNPDIVKKMSYEAHHFSLQQGWNKKIDAIVDQHYPL